MTGGGGGNTSEGKSGGSWHRLGLDKVSLLIRTLEFK